MNKRQFIKTVGLFGAATTLFGYTAAGHEEDLPFTADNQLLQDGKFTLPNLPYAYGALEEQIDKLTMEIHHDKHHKAYVDNLNKAIEGKTANWNSLEEILQKLNKKSLPALRNNAGGHWNHSFFWETMSPKKNQSCGAKTLAAINKAFGDIDKFKDAFSKAALGRFGSGWAWLCKDKKGDLFISSTPNQDNPLMKKLAEQTGTPILGIDVWEHAYYLKYQNKRADYIKSFFALINWEKVEERIG